MHPQAFSSYLKAYSKGTNIALGFATHFNVTKILPYIKQRPDAERGKMSEELTKKIIGIKS